MGRKRIEGEITTTEYLYLPIINARVRTDLDGNKKVMFSPYTVDRLFLVPAETGSVCVFVIHFSPPLHTTLYCTNNDERRRSPATRRIERRTGAATPQQPTAKRRNRSPCRPCATHTIRLCYNNIIHINKPVKREREGTSVTSPVAVNIFSFDSPAPPRRSTTAHRHSSALTIHYIVYVCTQVETTDRKERVRTTRRQIQNFRAPSFERE